MIYRKKLCNILIKREGYMFLFLLGLLIGSLAGMMLMAMLISARKMDDIKITS